MLALLHKCGGAVRERMTEGEGTKMTRQVEWRKGGMESIGKQGLLCRLLLEQMERGQKEWRERKERVGREESEVCKLYSIFSPSRFCSSLLMEGGREHFFVLYDEVYDLIFLPRSCLSLFLNNLETARDHCFPLSSACTFFFSPGVLFLCS